MPNAFTFLSTGTGEPDNAKVFCPVRRGTGRKGSNDLARGLPYLPQLLAEFGQGCAFGIAQVETTFDLVA